MSIIRISTLGRLTVRVDGAELPSFAQQRRRCALLVYLAMERSVQRDHIAALFWPNRSATRAKRLLSQMLYELKRTLGEAWFEVEGDRIVVDAAVDVHDVEAAVKGGRFEEAAELYRGSFLHDFALSESNGFETWVDMKRATCARLHRKARREMINRLAGANEMSQALAAAAAWLDLEPMDDEAHHRAIELLALTGQRTEALTHFDRYAALLRAEYDVAPLEETRALVERIRADTLPIATQEPAPIERLGLAPLTAHESHGATPRLGRRMAPAAIIVLMLLTGWLGFTIMRPAVPASVELAQAKADLLPTRVAVLYFEDLSENAQLAHMAKGLTESLIHQLDAVDALSVVSRYGVRPYATNAVPLDSTARALRVGTLLTGTVQRSRDSVRVTVQLLDATTGNRLGSAVLHERMGEIFALQDRLADEVAVFLRRRLGREILVRERRAGTLSADAWMLYQEADEARESLLDSRAVADPIQHESSRLTLLSADARLADAERFDPRWIEPILLRGWIAADLAAIAGSRDTAAYNTLMRSSLAHAARAIGLAPDDPAALELRGTVRARMSWVNAPLPGARDLAVAAERDLRLAVAADPALASAWSLLGRLVQYAGRFEEASLFAQRALSEDAYMREAADVHQRLFKLSWDTGNPHDAMRWCLTGYRYYPADARFTECQLAVPAWYPEVTLHLDSAVVLIERLRTLDPPDAQARGAIYSHVYRRALWSALLAHHGDFAGARAVLNELRARVRDQPALAPPFGFDEAHMLLVTGDTAGAAAALREYVETNPQYSAYIARFAPLAAAYGLRGAAASAPPSAAPRSR